MLKHRNPRLAYPRRKPSGGFARWMLNPSSQLARGITMAVLFDGPVGVKSAVDFAAPSRVYSVVGSPTFGVGQYGGQANSGFSGTACLSFTPVVAPSPTAWSASYLCKFDGSGHGDTGWVLLSCGPGGYFLLGCNNQTDSPFLVGGGSEFAQSSMTAVSLTGWHRIGVTCSGTTVRYFKNGALVDSHTMAGPLSGDGPMYLLGDDPVNFSWGWDVADFFFWNRALKDWEMAAHFADPYGSVLMPRGPEMMVGGSAVIPIPVVLLPSPVRRTDMVPY